MNDKTFSRALESQTTARQVQSPAERRKDIVAQAMQEQKIFEESVPKSEPVVKQEWSAQTRLNYRKLQFCLLCLPRLTINNEPYLLGLTF